jgi:hypothetical protein
VAAVGDVLSALVLRSAPGVLDLHVVLLYLDASLHAVLLPAIGVYVDQRNATRAITLARVNAPIARRVGVGLAKFHIALMNFRPKL